MGPGFLDPLVRETVYLKRSKDGRNKSRSRRIGGQRKVVSRESENRIRLPKSERGGGRGQEPRSPPSSCVGSRRKLRATNLIGKPELKSARRGNARSSLLGKARKSGPLFEYQEAGCKSEIVSIGATFNEKDERRWARGRVREGTFAF